MSLSKKKISMKLIIVSTLFLSLANLVVGTPLGGCPPCVPIPPEDCPATATTTVRTGFPPGCGCGCP